MFEGYGKSLISSVLNTQKHLNNGNVFYIDTEGGASEAGEYFTIDYDAFFHTWLENEKGIDVKNTDLHRPVFKKYYNEYIEMTKIKKDFK